MIKHDYYDKQGIKRRVLLPDENAPPEEGIPISVPVDKLYKDMPISFVIRLVEKLYALELVEAADFLKPGAAENVRKALLDTAKFDALDLITLANQNK